MTTAVAIVTPLADHQSYILECEDGGAFGSDCLD